MAAEPILAARAISIVHRRPPAVSPALADFWAMTKPEVNFLIAVTTGAAFSIASPSALPQLAWLALVNTLVGTVLVASGAATLNQWMERDFDARMRRTARRPISAGRIEPDRALRAGALLSLAGTAYLAFAVGTLPSLLAALTLLGYLFLYTPSKRITPLCTLIGAVPGAMPPLIGWAAARGRLDSEAWMLFAIVFLWQFPHFMAIAWMYRDDYDRAGFHVLPPGEAREHFVMDQTVSTSLLLALASVLPLVAGHARPVYGLGAVVLGGAFFDCATRFALTPSNSGARRLLLASIVYLPLQFALMLLAGLRWLPK
jgi:protoheme IX farnesyltransferase